MSAKPVLVLVWSLIHHHSSGWQGGGLAVHSLFFWTFWPSAVILRNYAAFEDLEVALNLVGVSAKAEEEVIVIHKAPLGSDGRGQQLFRGPQTVDQVADNAQVLHLEQQRRTSLGLSFHCRADAFVNGWKWSNIFGTQMRDSYASVLVFLKYNRRNG